MQRDCHAILQHPHGERRGTSASPLNQSLADSTLCALFSLLHDARPALEDRQACRQRHRLVERADTYVLAHIDRLVTVSELFTEVTRIFHKTGRISLNPLIKLGLRQ